MSNLKKLLAWAAALAAAAALAGGPAAALAGGPAAAQVDYANGTFDTGMGTTVPASQLEMVITKWDVGIGVAGFFGSGAGAQCNEYGCGEGVITATFSPSAVRGIQGLLKTNDVPSLIAAMQAPDWGAAVGAGRIVFSQDLLAKFRQAGVNIGWVYQRLYAQMDPGATPPPWVPLTPQHLYADGTGPLAPRMMAGPIAIPWQGQAAQAPAQAAPTPQPVVQPGTPEGLQRREQERQVQRQIREEQAGAPTPDQLKAQEQSNAVISVRPSPNAKPQLVPGAYAAPEWVEAHNRLAAAQAAARRRAWVLSGAGVLALILVGTLAFRAWRRGWWPFARRAKVVY